MLLTPIHRGGLGMVDIKEVVSSLRLRRHLYLCRHEIHPLSDLIKKLVAEAGYLGTQPQLDIDEVVKLNMMNYVKKKFRDCEVPAWILENDLILHSNLANTRIVDLVRTRKRQGAEFNSIRINAGPLFADVVRNGGRALTTLLKIANKEIMPALKKIAECYGNLPMPNSDQIDRIRNNLGQWVEGTSLTSKALRDILFHRKPALPKIIIIDDDILPLYFGALNKLISTQNKSRMLRLLQGDVYTAEKLVRFGLSENDRCKRCFEKETLMHLLMDCPYSQTIYSILQINFRNPETILGVGLSRDELEIRCDLLNYIIFQQRAVPPHILVRTTLEKYCNGLVSRPKLIKLAKRYLDQLTIND